MTKKNHSHSDSIHSFSSHPFKDALFNDCQALFFYHFQKALNLLWQNQNLSSNYDDLIDQVFYITETTESFSFYLVFSEHHIQIYHQYQPNREVDVKIVVDKKEIVLLLFDQFISNESEKNDKKDSQSKAKFQGDEKLENLKIYGKVKLAKQLVILISELDWDIKAYLKLILPNSVLALYKQLPTDSINRMVQSILKQLIGTIENFKKSGLTNQSKTQDNS